MPDNNPPDNRYTERLQASDLWFVVYRVTDHTQRAACYLCGWWSQGMQTDTRATIELSEHLATMEHQVAVREFVTAESTAIGAQDGYTCQHCLRTSWNAQDKARRYCGACHHFCDDVPTPPTTPPSQPPRPSPHPPAETGAVGAERDRIPPGRARWPW